MEAALSGSRSWAWSEKIQKSTQIGVVGAKSFGLVPSGRGVLDLVQKPRSSTQKHPPRFPNRLSWIDGRTVAVSRRSPGASGSGLGFSNGLKQAELENPASDTLCGDYNGNKKNFYCCGRAHFFQAEDRQEKIPGCRTSAGASATRGGGMVEGQKRQPAASVVSARYGGRASRFFRGR